MVLFMIWLVLGTYMMRVMGGKKAITMCQE